MAFPSASPPAAPPSEDTKPIQTAEGVDVDDLNDKIAKDLKPQIEANERQKKDLYTEWKRNVELRMGRIGNRASLTIDVGGTDDELQSEFNPDWFLTKTKIANLYSQVPQVQITHEAKQFAPAIPPFTKQLNYELSEKRSRVNVAMRETLADIVNAAGIGFVFVDYVARFEDKEVPAVDVSQIDPRMVEKAIALKLIPTKTVSQVVSDAFPITRVAPTDGIWPANFAGSDFDDADFLGYKGRVSEADAQNMFDLNEDDLQKAVEAVPSNKDETLQVDETVRAGEKATKKVVFHRVFYWRHRKDPDETQLKAIWELVYVKGVEKPVKHEPWSGQRKDEQTGKLVGVLRYPVRVGTIAYISDNPIVPSDSAASRPQTNDLRRSRQQMFQNRQRSTPLRWFNVNVVGPETRAQIEDGTFQGMIAVNGTGERAIGEVARASYPAEDLTFDQNAMADLLQTWGLTPQSMGNSTPGRKSTAETQATASGFSTNIGSDRALIQSFFLGIVEVLAGLMALYSEFPLLAPQEKQLMESSWDRHQILTDMVLKIRPDSMVVLDPQQRIQRLQNFLNMTVKSGFVNPQPIIVEMAELSGLDPAEVVIQPTPKQPEEPQLSYRFTGKEDLTNIAVVSMLAKHNALPSAEHVNTAKQFLLDAQNPNPAAPTPPGAAGGAPSATPPPVAGGAPVPHPKDAAAHPDWVLGSRVAKRSRDVSGG